MTHSHTSPQSITVEEETNPYGLKISDPSGRILRIDGLDAVALGGYFATRAQAEGSPWKGAKPGEHWELTLEGATREYVALLSRTHVGGTYVRFFPIADTNAVTLGVEATVITAGRLVRPDGAS
jgi:hypothetical protein